MNEDVDTRSGPGNAQDGRLTPSRTPSDALDRIMDLELVIHVELGTRRLRVDELLALGPGSVLDLDVAAGAALGVYANHTLIAQGEAVVVGERYGIRLTDIVTPAERVKRLGARGGAR